MTQHLLPEDTHEDREIMFRLGLVVAGFIAATAVMAIVIGITMG